MAKYTIESSSIIAAADKLNSAADTLLSDLTNYQTEVESLLSSWSGDTKSKFNVATSEDVSALAAKIQEVQLFTVYLKELMGACEELETELTKTEL